MTRTQQEREEDEMAIATSGVDYSAVEIPTKPPTDFDATERKADLLKQIQDLGHPNALPPQRELGDRYGVCQQQISRDLDDIADFVSENLGRRRDLVTESVFQRSIVALLEEGEYRKAAQTVKDWNEWLTERKELDELAEELELLKSAVGVDP